MTVASGTSTPTSMTVVATSTSSRPVRNSAIARSLSAGGSWPWRMPTRSPASSVAEQPLGLGHHRGRLDPLGPLDERADDEGPVPGLHLRPHPVPGLLDSAGRSGPSGWRPGSRPGGSSSMMVMSRSPNTTMAAVRGMGVAVITRRSGSPPPPSSPRPFSRSAARCSTPNRCCSSMTATPSEAEDDPVGEQGVGADEQVDRAVGQPGVDGVTLSGRRLRGEQRRPQGPLAGRGWPGRARSGPRAGPATAVACCSASTSVGAMRAPWWPPSTATSRADTATTVFPDPTSPCRSRCIGSGPARSSAMAAMARRWAPVSSNPRPATKRSTRVGRPSSRASTVADPPGVLLQAVPSQHQVQLEAEELVEGQPPTGRLALLQGGRPVDPVEGRRPVEEVEGGPQPLGQRVGERARAGRGPRRRSG